MNTNTNTVPTFRIRNLATGRIVSRGHTNLCLVCALIWESAERLGWEAE